MQWEQLKNPNNQTYDVVICTVPWTDTTLPLMAPAVLKKTAEQAGLTCLSVDLNIEMVNWTVKHPEFNKILKFFFEEKLDPTINHQMYGLLSASAVQLLSFKPKWVGLSAFSYVCQTAIKWMCYFIRKLDPNVKIVIGGPGCLPTMTGNSEFVNAMLRNKLIDYHIRGDAEISFYHLLTGNTEYPGINDVTWKELTSEEIRSLPIPDYDDYRFDFYETAGIPIIGSRGCVRQCTFCDYIANWKKYHWRTAEHIWDEIMFQVNRYGVTYIKFQDSLTNGNQKEFNKLMILMANYNDKHPFNKLSWGGYFIFREHHANSEKEWEILARSGCTSLAVGIESFSQHIRYEIGKKFSNEAIIFHLQQAQLHKINIHCLMIVGYINETRADIEYTKQWLRDHTRLKDIIKFHWGTGLGIFENTHLGNNKDKLGITMIGKNAHEWVSTRSDSTPEMRIGWSIEIRQLAKQLGYNVSETVHDIHYLLERSFVDKDSEITKQWLSDTKLEKQSVSDLLT